MTKSKLVALLAAVLIAGCAIQNPTPDQLSTADYGTYVSQSEAEQLARNYLTVALKDPYSAVIQFGAVERGWIRDAPISGGALHYGYLLNASVNAKNSFGGYTGAKAYRFVLRDGRLALVMEIMADQSSRPVATLESLPPATYTPAAKPAAFNFADAAVSSETKSRSDCNAAEVDQVAVGWSKDKLRACSTDLRFVTDVGAGIMKSEIYSVCSAGSCKSVTVENGTVTKVD